MKAIYTKIGPNVYKIKQNTNIPSDTTYKLPGVSSSLNIDPANKYVVQNISINTLQKPGTKSNAQMYKELTEYIKEQEITEIKEIQNYFNAYIDYTMFQDGREIDHAQVVRPIQPVDKALLLGVATNNECVFRRVKTFNPTIDFKLRSMVPHGIMKTSRENYVLKINNVAIFQSLHEFHEVHNSTYNVSYGMHSPTMISNLEDYVMVYSTYDAGIELQEISLRFVPRDITVALDVILSDYIVVYDDNTITNILLENIDKKYSTDDSEEPGTEAPDDGSDDSILIPDDDTKPEADGNFEPDEDGYIDWYERCTDSTPSCLLVVEDLISDADYDPNTMIKKSMVIKDIEDIEVGEYVIYRESFLND